MRVDHFASRENIVSIVFMYFIVMEYNPLPDSGSSCLMITKSFFIKTLTIFKIHNTAFLRVMPIWRLLKNYHKIACYVSRAHKGFDPILHFIIIKFFPYLRAVVV